MKDFSNTYKIKGSPEDVFTALTNPFTIELWTGYPAKMDDKEGTEFSMWDGDIVGKNKEIRQNKKIVQEWYFGDQEEQSIVTIELFRSGKGTRVKLIHINIPDVAYENMKTGWNEYFFGNLQRFFDI
ncbi:MAG: SRPBCC domain-containing protein [Bacteroidales bacterium]